MKVCIVYPRGNILPKEFDRFIQTRPAKSLPPLGMLYIASNSNVDFIDNRVENLGDLSLFYRLQEYDIVGFGGTLFEADQAVAVSGMLRSFGVWTVYGGANATVSSEMYVADFSQIVIGEADTYDFKSREKIVRGSRIKNLDNLDWPDRTNINDYNRIEKWLDFPTDTVVSSRGCPYDCSFCSSKVIWNKRYTMRSSNSVLDEINYLVGCKGTKSIYFREDNFTVNKKRLKAICGEMPVMFKCESRVDAIDSDTAKIMSDGGCKVIWFGIEHTCDSILNTVSKGTTYKRTVEALSACEKHGIKTVGSFIVGLPEERLSDMVKNWFHIRKLKLNHVSLNRAYAFAKSEMHTEILEHGLDAYSYNGIILPRTKHVNRRMVDLVHLFMEKYFSLYEKYIK